MLTKLRGLIIVDEKQEYRKKYYEANKERLKAHMRQYYDDNKEQMKAAERARYWRRKNLGISERRQIVEQRYSGVLAHG